MPPPVAAVLLLWTTAVVAEALVFKAVVECAEWMGVEETMDKIRDRQQMIIKAKCNHGLN